MWKNVLQEPHTRCLITTKSKGGRNKEPLQMRDQPHVDQNQTYVSERLSVAFNKGQLTSTSKPSDLTSQPSTKKHTVTCQDLIPARKS